MRPSRIVVRLPGPGARFTAIAGVDSNEQTSGGRGSVDFSVQVGGAEKFRSGVMREGMAGKPVGWNWTGRRSSSSRSRKPPDGIACDQADWAEAKVTLKDGSELWLADLPLRDGRDESPYTTEPPFSFVYDGKASADLLRRGRASEQTRKLDAQRTERTLNGPIPRPACRCGWRASSMRISRRSSGWCISRTPAPSDTPILSDIQGVDLAPGARRPGRIRPATITRAMIAAPDSYAPRQLTLEPKSEHRFAPAGGRPTSVGFPYFNLEWPGEGLIVVIGWPGQWAARFTRDAGNGLRVRGGQELTRFKLHPGEEARTPLIALQFWQGDRVRAQNLWRRWMVAHNLPRARDGKPLPPILTSCSGGFFPGLRTSEESERQFITAFAQAGVKLDYWWMDAGWYTCTDWPQTGTWTPDPIRYPRGFKPVSELAHSKGHGADRLVRAGAGDARHVPLHQQPRLAAGHATATQKLLNLGNPDARRWLTDHVDAMLTREGIDFYRQDFNIDPLGYWRDNDAPDRQGLTEMRHVEGYLAYWDELRRRHPGLPIDSCASGGRRNDLETLRRAVPLLRSDYQSFDGNPAYAPGNQGHTYGLSSWIPYYGQGVYFTDRDFVYSVRSYLSPAFGICADVRKPGVDWALIRRLADQWRQVADCFLGDFYPLTSYQLNEELWLAWQFDLPEQSRGMVQVFRRAGSHYESARFKLRNLNPAATYVVTDLDQPATPQELSGRELLDHGLLISAPEQPSARLITYQQSNKDN